MSFIGFTYEIAPEAQFEDRYQEMITLGIAKADVDKLRATITDMWADAPGGWAYEWSAVAATYRKQGDLLKAALAYSFAKFPCAANQARLTAQENQIACYLEAAPGFPVKFERRTVAIPFGDDSFDLPVHLFSASGQFEGGPVLLLSGGVDGFKIDVHGICVELSQRLGMTVLAFDLAGTGEAPIPLTRKGGDAIIAALAKYARRIGNGKVGYMGISFGGNFAAMAGLSGIVDAAVVNGGPIEKSFTLENAKALPYGMRGIIGNDMHYTSEPSVEEYNDGWQQFNLRDLLDRTDNTAMLVINGQNDYFVPLADTLVFASRARTDVHVLGDTGHCALLAGKPGGTARTSEVVDLVTAWLPGKLASAT